MRGALNAGPEYTTTRCRRRAALGMSAGLMGTESGISRGKAVSSSGPKVTAGPSGRYPVRGIAAAHETVAENGWTPQRKLPESGSSAPTCSAIDAPPEASGTALASTIPDVPAQGAGSVGASTSTSKVVVVVFAHAPP